MLPGISVSALTAAPPFASLWAAVLGYQTGRKGLLMAEPAQTATDRPGDGPPPAATGPVEGTRRRRCGRHHPRVGLLLASGTLRAQLQQALEDLLASTGADRTTLRMDLPAVGLHVDFTAAEAVAPGVRSIRRDGSLDQRALNTVLWLEQHRKPLVQPHFREAPQPPEALRTSTACGLRHSAPSFGATSWQAGSRSKACVSATGTRTTWPPSPRRLDRCTTHSTAFNYRDTRRPTRDGQGHSDLPRG
jgi:hypothetical protein